MYNMVTIVGAIFIGFLLKDLINIDRKYLNEYTYSIPFLLGIVMILVFWISVIYYENFSECNIPYTLTLLLPFGFTLFFKGGENLCKLKGVFDNEYNICKKGYKSMLILDIYIVIASFIYILTY